MLTKSPHPAITISFLLSSHRYNPPLQHYIYNRIGTSLLEYSDAEYSMSMNEKKGLERIGIMSYKANFLDCAQTFEDYTCVPPCELPCDYLRSQ
jgi:hypothetical protein